MPLKVPVAHDFICPWCWVGLFQAKRLQEEFGAELEWQGYELYPDELAWPEPAPPAAPPPANKPSTPSRLDFLLACENMTMPAVVRPRRMRTHNAHEAVEYAKTEGVQDALVERLYRAYWEEGREINDPKVLLKLAEGIVQDLKALKKAIKERTFREAIVGFDDPANAAGVYNVPTFFVGDRRLAEQPYSVIAQAVRDLLNDPASGIYEDLVFPKAPSRRPTVFMNMVATIDGKILTGERNESVHDLGSKTDHQLMRRIERGADAVLLGANTLRATPGTWSPSCPVRIAVTQSGDVDWTASFFTKGKAFVACPEDAAFDVPEHVEAIRVGKGAVDLPSLFRILRKQGIMRLLVLGGSELNADILRNDLVDDLFLTLAPKIKLGRDVPTYAGGEALPREAVQKYDLVEHHVVADEVFLRYRRRTR